MFLRVLCYATICLAATFALGLLALANIGPWLGEGAQQYVGLVVNVLTVVGTVYGAKWIRDDRLAYKQVVAYREENL